MSNEDAQGSPFRRKNDPPESGLHFRWPWRPYQARVLEAVEKHLHDGRLHLVAAPGSGKTILGLEVFRRLGQPALVLSPTRTIRDQWIERLRDFLPTQSEWPPAWVSTDLERPALFTSITYQSLHARHRRGQHPPGPEEIDAEADSAPSGEAIRNIVALCRRAGFATLILDEAHHLRIEWWKALSRIAEELEGVVLVSLTATPPYDAAGQEWRRYQELCGPIDEEVSVPELVRAGNLCPHQDYLWLVAPQSHEQTVLYRHDQAAEALARELLNDPDFRQAVREHPWISVPQPEPDQMLEAPEHAIALLVLLRAVGDPLPKNLLSLFDLLPAELPPLDRRWWQVLLRGYLFDPRWPQSEKIAGRRSKLARRMREEGLLWRREVRLADSRNLKNQLSLTANKIEACLHIYRQERRLRGEALRQVILTDYIRESSNEPALGAWPIFRELAGNSPPEEAARMGLLTGRLAIFPERLRPLLTAGRIDTAAVEGLEGFFRIVPAGAPLIQRATELLWQGELQVLVGTRSLLGEGWDAPAINSLILATAVGSYMLTNQMRGRAIRVDAGQPEKAASIWHLAAVDPSTPSGLEDLADLVRRFKTFVGVAADAPVIESGLERLALPFMRQGKILPFHIAPARQNEAMIRRLEEVGRLRQQWAEAVGEERKGKILPGIRTERPPSLRPFHFTRTLGYFLLESGLLFIAGAGQALRGMSSVRPQNPREIIMFISVAALGGAVLVFPRFVRSLKALVRHLPVDGALNQIALALRDALCEAGVLRGDPTQFTVLTTHQPDGSFIACLQGGEFYERALFADSLQQVLGPIENPRYLVNRQSRVLGSRRDFHAVPQLLASNKERAQIFLQAWIRRVSPAELVFTRNAEGRRQLLQARGRAFSTLMAPPAERMDRWQ